MLFKASCVRGFFVSDGSNFYKCCCVINSERSNWKWKKSKQFEEFVAPSVGSVMN